MDARYIAAESTAGGSKAAVLCARQSGMLFACANIIDGDYGVDCDDLSWTFVSNIVIDAAVGTGLSANLNSAIRKQNVTNNAGTPESTASGGVIA
ncbi:MAG: hypothetical protein JSV02_10205 [Dehalococcoidia bacterium]|nr:MAG: hypothetical protein JSV02_10205 [Dehalococcoidia bacterium]